MPRRITSGSVGNPSVGGVVVSSTANLTTADNSDISITPSGTGRFIIGNNTEILSGNQLRFRDSDDTNYVGFVAPSLSSNIVWTLPNSDGSTNQILATNGSGTLSWITKDISITNETSSASTHYITLTTSTSGGVTGLNVSSSKLTFQPSTGTLSCTSITETSSITVKENINVIENALDSITKLSGVTYYRKDNNEFEPGLIAEWVNDVIPSVVTKDEFGNPSSIKYTKIIAYLIESIKTLKNEIDSFKMSIK